MVSNCIFTVWVPFSRKIYGVSRGVRVSDGDLKMQSILKHWPSRQARRIPWLGVSNRGEKHPCWHTILLAKSSVLYLLRPLTLERGCSTPDSQFQVAAEQTDFVGWKEHKTKDLAWAESDCSGVVGIGNLVAVRKDFLCQRGRKRYIKTRRSDQLPLVKPPR